MIVGIGTDLVELTRIADSMERFGKRFLSRIYSEREIAYTTRWKSHQRLVEWAAGRFAAKEAVAKAWGTGIGETMRFHEIEVLPDEKGKPNVYLPNDLLHPLCGKSYQIHVSITHSTTHAMAFVVIERCDITGKG